MAYTVVVRHPDTDEPVALLAGEPVPGWAADMVSGDDLVGSPEPEPEPEVVQPAGEAIEAAPEPEKPTGRRTTK